MKPVSIMWTQGVDTAEAQLAVSAVRDFLRLVYSIGHRAGLALPPTTIRPFGTWYIPSQPEGSPYWGTHWYIDNSFDATRQQVIGARFLELVREEPWQKASPHWDVALIDRDLVDSAPAPASEGCAEFALGASVPELATVLSVFRLRGLVRPEQRERALRRLVLHQFGEVLGLPSRSRQTGLVTGFDQRSCAHRCVMHRAATVEQLVLAAEQEHADRVLLCEQCQRDVVEIMVMRGRSPN
ncbi:MAG TPA: hypothetical protein VNL16_08300 [Chloroflexota bacterium]|nr:hypothetical protein [Chloroflexota bacterium]